jgi:hypothetical protein
MVLLSASGIEPAVEEAVMFWQQTIVLTPESRKNLNRCTIMESISDLERLGGGFATANATTIHANASLIPGEED